MEKTGALQKLKSGFQSSFWVANGMELFERLAYYGQATILSVFLRDHLKFDEVEAGQLSSIFGGLIYFLPVFAGALADKFGFKKAFSFAFFVLAIGYFLIGSTGMSAFSSWYSNTNLFPILSIILIFTAIGGSFIKPSVLGTVALTTTSETKSLGYAIYYWLVNIGGAIGPLLAFLVRDSFGIEFVYFVSAISCALMFVITLTFYKEPTAKIDEKKEDLATVIKNLITVVKNVKFMFFLMLFALYWIVFWEFFIVVPFYVSDYISPDAPIELILSTGAWTIILLQIPINRITKNIPTPSAIMIGFVFAALSWFILYFSQITGITIGIGLIAATMFTFSVGEQTQAPRFYEYLADLAPKGQEALFQGFAFLPIAIAWLVGGTFGGWLYHNFGRKEVSQPEIVFLVIGLVGVTGAVLMWIYNKFLVVRK
ncbi:MAG TPA: MFS transporter [Ignavibacteriaceae bacterium]|nr:MAG: Multidrug resistance protein MdtH [Ignavibacteria bacterium ADurb.Bin266]OQY71412.1 MAG: MFS transporter [Ignavibacteriales bacterium UTCHB2]HQF41410.1 MFS transporter [Ignavibacteriaceae bacterium]HQI40138.1 MFS transporter [Ignavibacteriaceae bacterium]HQJ45925.1 MFS transporter [Ignavibacteriaceae bacterium]